MSYFDTIENVKEYIEIADGFDGSDLIEILKNHLAEGSTVLELGMGPGKDLDILKKTFVVTGSDKSKVFIELYKENNPDADLLILDAITIDTERKFNCIYSNKVLMHLEKDDLINSLQRQKQILVDNGLLFHSFWYGNKREEHHGLLFNYYTESDLKEIINNEFEIIEMKIYTEMDENDSIYVLLKNK